MIRLLYYVKLHAGKISNFGHYENFNYNGSYNMKVEINFCCKIKNIKIQIYLIETNNLQKDIVF